MAQPFKILLVEPLPTGHRPVILRYAQKCLAAADIAFQVAPAELGARYADLCTYARSHGCTAVHFLTFDGMLRDRRFLREVLTSSHGLPIFGNQHLYTSLYHPLASIMISVLDWRQGLHLMVSDEYRKDRVMPAATARRISYIPDPWDPEEFHRLDQSVARKRLELPDGKVIFLLFGELSERKGLRLLLEAGKECQAKNAVILIAGRIAENVRCRDLISENQDRVILHDHYIEESLVAAYFSAADYVATPYPRWFDVSSGSATRAFAAGRPILAPDHGVLARDCKERGVGMVFPSENVSALAAAMEHAVQVAAGTAPWEQMSLAAAKVAAERTLEHYGKRLVAAYRHMP